MSINEWKEQYIDPRIDFGFNHLFGTPMNIHHKVKMMCLPFRRLPA